MKMEVESNLVALHGSRIPEMLGTFHLDDHNVQEWSDVSKPGLKHRARQEVGKWIDSDKNADIQFQKREDSKQSERGREQQIGFVVIGNAPDASFQIVQSQRKLNDDSGARVSTMSTSYQMSSTRGVHSTTKTTSNKTTTKTVTVSGGRSDDFDTIKMSFQPLDTSTQRERLNVTRAGTMGVRRPPTRRHTPAAVLPTTPDDDDDMMGTGMNGDAFERSSSPAVRITEIHSSSSSKMDSSAASSPVPIVGFKPTISPKIRVGFPVEIQLELQSKLRYSNGGGSEEMVHHIETELNDDDEETEIESSSRLLSPSTLSASSSSNMTKTAITSSSSSLTPATAASTITDTNNFRSSSSSKMQQQQQESSTKIIEAERSHESIDANESADSLFHPLSNSTNNNGSLTFDFNSERRKSYGFEPFDTEQSEATPTISEVETTTTSPCNILNNNNNSNNNSNIYSKPTTHTPVKSAYERPTNNNFNLTPSSLSRSWDLIQSVTNAQQRREANKKLFSSSSTLDDLGNSLGSKSMLASHSHSKAPQKTIITLNAFEENDGDSDASPEFSTTNNYNKRRLSHEFTLDSLEPFPNNNNKNNSYLSSRMNNSRRSVSSDNIEKSQIIGSPPDIIHHNIKQQQQSTNHNDNVNKSPSALSFEKSRNIIKMLDETPDLLNKMSFKHYYPPSNVETIEIQPTTTTTKPAWNYNHSNSETNGTQLDYLNDSLNRILNEGKDFNNKSNNHNHSQNSSSKYSFGKNERMTTVNNKTNNNNNNIDDEDFDEDVVVNKTGKQTQISHTWISSIDQKKPSQHARDTDVTTSISATNDPFKRAQKKVEFCKTEVHFTPDSGKFHIVETDENKPSTVHLFRRKKRGDKKSTSSTSSSSVSSSSTSTSSTSTNSTETKKLVEKFSEKRDKINHEQTSDERKLHHDTSTNGTTRHGRTIGAELNNNNSSSSEGLERVKKSAVVDMMVGVDDEDKKKRNSLFHRWTEQDAKPEDEETVTPTTTTMNNISSSSLNHGNRELDQIELNFDDDDKLLDTTTTTTTAKVPSLQLRRDKNKLLVPDFDEPIIHHGKTTTHSSKRGDKGSLRNYSSNTTLINELLNDLGDEGDDGDESRTDMILSNYGDELKIQRYLKQLKSPSSHTGSESPTDFLHMNDDYDEVGGRDPDQTNFDRDGDDDDDDSSKNFHFDNVLYENGSFVPRATRRSLIEMNNRNRKRIGGGSHSHTSDASSTTSNYSLPHSDRDSNYQPLKLATMEATVATLGKPQITSVELRYALDKDKNSYFSEPVKRNFRIPPKSSDKIDKEEEHIYDVPTPVKPVGLRSLPPPYNKNARSVVTTSPVGGLSTPLRPTNSYHHSKPPLPILPSLFSSFEKTGLALRKRSELKNQSIGINSENKLEESNDGMTTTTENVKSTKSEQNYVPSTSIVTIGGDSGESVNNKKKSEDYNNLSISHESSKQQVETDEVGIDGITISPEFLLNMDGTWQGPAHQNSFNEHQHNNNKGTSVMRSMTFPKSRTEPEWVTKARNREARQLDWSLIGSKQNTNNASTTTRSSPPWISDIRFKSKVVTPSPEIQSLPKISIVYPWQRRSTTTEDSSEPIEKEADNTMTHNNIKKMSFQEKDQTTNRKYGTTTTPDHHKIEQSEIVANGVEIVELLPDEDRNKDDRIVTGKPPPHSTKKTEYASTGHDYHHSNRDSDSILINPIQIPARDSSLKNEKKSSHLKRNNNNNTDYSVSAIDKKLFAPLLESTKQSRKPLQSSQHSNKNSNININNNAITTTTNHNNNKLIPSDKQLKKPPRPPKPTAKSTPPPPPLRSSSLNCKSAMTDKTNNSNNNNKRTLRASPEESMIASSNRSTPVQVHRHPLVKVAKLPTTKTSVIISSSPDSKLKKAKYQVSLINEKNQTDHRHPGSQQSSSNPMPTATIASPHRKR